MGKRKGKMGEAGDKITIGVCVMEKKVGSDRIRAFGFARFLFSRAYIVFSLQLLDVSIDVRVSFQAVSPPMEQILERLRAFGEFEVLASHLLHISFLF